MHHWKSALLLLTLAGSCLVGCDEKPTTPEASKTAPSATPEASKTAPSATPVESATPRAAKELSPAETYAAFLARVEAKKPLAEIASLMTKAEAEKVTKQVEGAKDPKRMLGFFYRVHDPKAEGHDPTPKSEAIEGETATVTYGAKDPKNGAEFVKTVTFAREEGAWRVSSIEMKAAK